MAATAAAGKLKTYASFVKLEHTVFSLPLIFAGTVLAQGRWPSVRLAVLVLVAAAAARIVAMGLNRIVDAELDARNPRTQRRELPRGAMQRAEAWGIVALAILLYVASAAAIAPICAWLSPIPVILFFIYPYLKRVTALAHLGLGVAWSLGPLAGWVAAAQTLRGLGQAGWLWFFSVLWVAGFDIIYATMDEAFDRAAGVHALPAAIGKRPALRVAAWLHLGAFASLVLLWRTQLHGAASLGWLAAVGGLFLWQHAVAARDPELAFFKLNGVLGFLVFGVVIAGI